MEDPLLLLSGRGEAAAVPMKYPVMKVKNLHESSMSTLFAQESLKAETICPVWSPIFRYTVDKLDCLDRDSDLSHYNSTKELLLDYLEKDENVAYSRANAAMNLW